jgi:hypothetical protein
MGKLWVEVTIGNMRIAWSAMSLFHRRTEGLEWGWEVDAGNWEPEDDKGCCAADERNVQPSLSSG